MKFIGTLLFIFVFSLAVWAQKPVKYKQPRVLVLLDGSSSMVQPWNNKDARFKVAANIVSRIIDSVYKFNDQVEFGLRVYGHQYPVQENNCFDTKNEVMFSKKNSVQMFLRVSSIHPIGISPIAYSLKEAAEKDLIDEQNNAYTIILITDGGESCNGNICEVAKMLAEKKIYFKPYIIGLADYAPLKQQYECLGNYLLANNDEHLTEAITTIASGYKQAFTRPIPTTITLPEKKPVPTPVVATVTPAPKPEPTPVKQVIPEPAKRDEADTAALPSLNRPTLNPINRRIQVIENATKTIPVTQPTPTAQLPDFETISPINKQPEYAPVNPEIPIALNHIPVPAIKQRELVIDFPKVKAPVAVTQRTVAAPVISISKNYLSVNNPPPSKNVTPEVAAPAAPKPAPPVAKTPPVIPKATPPPPVAKPPVAQHKATPPNTAAHTTPLASDNQQINAPYTTETVTAETTTLEVYFTDGKGKYYSTTPQMQLYDHKTGKPVKDFYRTTDAAGNPDPQKLEAGVYDLGYKDQPYILSGNITIVANNKNKVMIRVPRGSIHFFYTTNPKRPVKEFNARVTLRFEQVNPTVEQHADDILPYEAGNYYAEVNTLPITRYNLDVLFGAEVQIPVREPGEAFFTNTNAVGRVQLFHPLGDKYVPFHVINITGDTARQYLRLQPMMYEAHYSKNPRLPNATEMIVKFLVKSNETVNVVLP